MYKQKLPKGRSGLLHKPLYRLLGRQKWSKPRSTKQITQLPNPLRSQPKMIQRLCPPVRAHGWLHKSPYTELFFLLQSFSQSFTTNVHLTKSYGGLFSRTRIWILGWFVLVGQFTVHNFLEFYNYCIFENNVLSWTLYFLKISSCWEPGNRIFWVAFKLVPFTVLFSNDVVIYGRDFFWFLYWDDHVNWQ